MFKLKLITACSTVALVLAIAATTQAQQPAATKPPRKAAAPRPAAKRATPAAPKPATAKPPVQHAAQKSADDAPPVHAAPPADADSKKAPAKGEALNDTGPKIEKNPAVLSALEMQRTKPADYVQSILLLLDLGRPELAKPILADLTKLQMTDAQRQELVDQFGAGSLVKIANAKELAPEGGAFATACMKVANAITNDPKRIAALIKQLSDPTAEARLLAQHDLAATGPAAATATLEAFAKETDRNRRAALAAGIIAMHPIVDGMLLAMLDTRDQTLHTDVSDLLRQLQVAQAHPLVTVSEGSAEQSIATALSSYERGTPIFVPEHDGQVELWQWNDTTKQLSSTRLPADEARIVWMSKLARTLTEFQPENPDYQRRALILAWEAESTKQPANNWPINPKFVSQADPHFLDETLTESLKNNHAHAAVSAIQAMAERHDQGILMTPDGKPSPLADALTSPNRNVRFAALTAIMALDPPAPYPGSSRVPDALAWFAESCADRRALVAMPTNAASTELAAQLTTHQLVAEATNNGRELLSMARKMTDVEMIFVDMDILLPNIREVVYQLRMNPTTGETPIAILAPEGRLEAAKRIAEEHQRVIAVPRPHTEEIVANTVKQLTALIDRDSPPTATRTAQANQAKVWLDKLETGARPFYVIRRTARLTPAPAPRNAPEPLPPQ